jgi:anaerobic selenocysteine-containing dehydrogenase
LVQSSSRASDYVYPPPKGRVTVIDPAKTLMAARADLHLQIRPGSDGALALGMLNVIINEHLFDRKFVEEWTNAPHLIRTDTGKLLRESDLTAEGSTDNFAVWDRAGQRLVTWDAAEVARPDRQAHLMAGRGLGGHARLLWSGRVRFPSGFSGIPRP